MDINDILKEIDRLKSILDAAPPFNDGELRRLQEHFMVEYTYNSNAIEGNTLTLHETALVVLEGLTIDKKPLRDHLEAVGHRDAFEYVINIAKSDEPLSERVIKDIHALVLMDDAQNRGKYREMPVKITGALDTPPDPLQIPIQMDALLKDYNLDQRHPIVKIADFHIKFEGIHPFIDGNGRTGRLILNLELIKARYAPINVKFADRSTYINCFRDYAVSGSSKNFVMMVAKYELEELTNLISITSHKEGPAGGSGNRP